MPFPRRGRRRPFINSRWQVRRLDCLCLYLSTNVRTMLTAWMKIYGETNDVPGLVSGPIEVRFRRLREHTGADIFLLWTTPEHWAGGEALSLWIPAMGLALECRVDAGKLVVDKARPTTDEERDPRRQRSAIGMELRPERIELPPPDDTGENPSAGLVAAFERLLDRRWTSFVDPLREALEAEARDDTVRAERLATPYAVATPRIGSQSESDPYRLSGVEASAVAAFDEGEWLDLVDTRGRVISSARLVRIDPAEGTMDVDVRGADPPTEGVVRPRPQTQILAQKRAILDELDNPTGGLANAVRLVASPASLPPPQRRRPAEFVNRLVAQNKSQVRAVSLALGLEEGQALMVQGPPGTGKSTTLAEILGQLVTRDTNVTVLVCSHSNHGVDNLLLKTLPYLGTVPGLAIARVGLFDRVHPQARPHYVPPGEDLGAFNVVFTTVDALALQVEAGGRTYDYAVLDEANRASILDSLIPLVRGRRFILVGDHLQLQPVLSEAEEQLRLEPAVGNTSAIGKSLFAWLRERRFPEAATVFLDEQNRMHPLIAGLISEVFYEGKLRSGRRAPRRVADVPIFPSAVTWVDTRGLHGLREARGRGASLVNVPEARLVATIARHILGSSQKEVEVGVISAYAEQTALLRRLLLHRNNQRGPQNGMGKNGQLDRAALKLLEIDTVDAFEGREKDIIIVSLVRSNRRRDIGFLRLMQRINVALSRARTMLIVVGDTSTLRGSYFDKIVRYVRANGMLVPGPRLIGRLLNARNAERTGTGERTERAAGAGRRRRALPSARNAFPIQDPTQAAAGGAGEGAADEGAGGRGRRRRRRVRGRAGQDQQQAPPTTTMEMSPAAEPGPDEPATQYEIDRFAALVEQLLGDTSGEEGSGGAEPAPLPEEDRARAEEVLADALRAVGEQAERSGPSRSRRNNNRRRSRRGQARPLPGDAAVADAARRMAREELLAAGGADTLPMLMPGDEITDQPGETPVRPAAEAAPAGAAATGDTGRVPAVEPPPVQPPARPRTPIRAFRPLDEPALPPSPSRGAPPAGPVGSPFEGEGGTPDPARTIPRRTRRRAPAAGGDMPAARGGMPPARGDTVASSGQPVPETPTVAPPARDEQPALPVETPDAAPPLRTRRRRTAAAAAGAEDLTLTTGVSAEAGASQPTPAVPVSEPVPPVAAPVTGAPAASLGESPAVPVAELPAGGPSIEEVASAGRRRTRRAAAAATPETPASQAGPPTAAGQPAAAPEAPASSAPTPTAPTPLAEAAAVVPEASTLVARPRRGRRTAQPAAEVASAPGSAGAVTAPSGASTPATQSESAPRLPSASAVSASSPDVGGGAGESPPARPARRSRRAAAASEGTPAAQAGEASSQAGEARASSQPVSVAARVEAPASPPVALPAPERSPVTAPTQPAAAATEAAAPKPARRSRKVQSAATEASAPATESTPVAASGPPDASPAEPKAAPPVRRARRVTPVAEPVASELSVAVQPEAAEPKAPARGRRRAATTETAAVTASPSEGSSSPALAEVAMSAAPSASAPVASSPTAPAEAPMAAPRRRRAASARESAPEAVASQAAAPSVDSPTSMPTNGAVRAPVEHGPAASDSAPAAEVAATPKPRRPRRRTEADPAAPAAEAPGGVPVAEAAAPLSADPAPPARPRRSRRTPVSAPSEASAEE